MCVHTCMCAYMHVCIHACVHTCMCAYSIGSAYRILLDDYMYTEYTHFEVI